MTQHIKFEKMGSIIFVLPLLPYTAPPTVAATSPREQNTDARPNANDNVGRSIFLSFLSPAAVDIYLIIVVIVQFYSTIKGRRQTHFLSFPCIKINQIKSNQILRTILSMAIAPTHTDWKLQEWKGVWNKRLEERTLERLNICPRTIIYN